ncbi:MAG TPA: tetratricopeptide repeat protein [Vicinamibacterales bacterium]|nr:tetratricopeptide repeat protein [Vicinamibacterales bacterium]
MIHGFLSAASFAVVAAVAQQQNPTALDTLAQLRAAAQATPRNPRGWYELGQGYNVIKQNALSTFTSPADAPWRALLSADALLENGQLTDAFTLYRAALESLPSMANIHDSVARIYERSGHTQWAVTERGKIDMSADDCVARRALCEFRAARYDAALEAAMKASDAEGRYWTARAANELALAAFMRLDTLPDSVERRSVRAAVAQAQERHTDAVAELKAAVSLAPQQPEVQYQLASAYYSARDYEASLATLTPLLKAYPDDVRLLTVKAQALSQLQRADEALPILKQLVDRNPNNSRMKLALGRAYLQTSHYTEAIPLLQEQLSSDSDGSLHMQLARAYSATSQHDKAAPLLARSEELRKADEERRAATATNVITAPK